MERHEAFRSGMAPAISVVTILVARYLRGRMAMRGQIRIGLALVSALMISACAARSSPPSTPVPTAPALTASTEPRTILDVRQGLASYYGPGFEGRRTASGIAFDKTAMVAAHPTYPFGTVIRVTNLANKKQVVVRVVDRGPAKGPRAEGVVIDLSSGAAANLGFLRKGRTRVRLEVMRWGGVTNVDASR
jgi:rare lipoprotein A